MTIQGDTGRFIEIVKQKVRKDLKKYMSTGEMIGRKGRDLVSIPIPYIDTPDFRLDPQKRGGVAQGKGEEGELLGPPGGDPQGGAGQGEGTHILEVEFTLQELADILGQELELPRIEPKGRDMIVSTRTRYSGVRIVGPESLRLRKRSFVHALKRTIASGTYDPFHPTIYVTKEDKRYRNSKQIVTRNSSAVIIYMMDISGSAGDDIKEIIRTECFWIDTWLRSQYKGIVSRYIVHDAVAKEVTKDVFYRTRESGGTLFSSAYSLCRDIILKEYPLPSWNVYTFHFTDGQNWKSDNDECVTLLRDSLLPRVNMFGFGRVGMSNDLYNFLEVLIREFEECDNIVLSDIPTTDAIFSSIKEFFGKGR